MSGPQIDTVLVQGDGSGSALRIALEDVAGRGEPDCLVLLSLGANHASLLAAVTAARGMGVGCPVFLSETFGIIGFDRDLGRNIELMEKGRGSEYGCCGGTGGQGTVVVAFRGAGMVAVDTPQAVPGDAFAVLVLADGESELPDLPCALYGGVTKQNFQLHDGKFTRTGCLFLASVGGAVAVATVEEDIAGVVEGLMTRITAPHYPSGVVGLFPCFTRGINAFDRNNVEPDAVSDVMQSCRLFGMFVHGEFGPPSGAGTAVFAMSGSAKTSQVVPLSAVVALCILTCRACPGLSLPAC